MSLSKLPEYGKGKDSRKKSSDKREKLGLRGKDAPDEERFDELMQNESEKRTRSKPTKG